MRSHLLTITQAVAAATALAATFLAPLPVLASAPLAIAAAVGLARTATRAAAALATVMPIVGDLEAEQTVVAAVEAEPTVELGVTLDVSMFAWPALAARWAAAGPTGGGPPADPQVLAAAGEVAACHVERTRWSTDRSPLVANPEHDPDRDTVPAGISPLRRAEVSASPARRRHVAGIAAAGLWLLVHLGPDGPLAADLAAAVAAGTVVTVGVVCALIDLDTRFAPTGLLRAGGLVAVVGATAARTAAGDAAAAIATGIVAATMCALVAWSGRLMGRIRRRTVWGGADTVALPAAFIAPAILAADPFAPVQAQMAFTALSVIHFAVQWATGRRDVPIPALPALFVGGILGPAGVALLG